MVHLLTVMLTVFTAIATAGSAGAVPPEKKVEYAGAGYGKVIFDGKVHHDAGFQCANCHTKIFPMKKGSVRITMAAIDAGKFCGVCHDGTKGFRASDEVNCIKCHKK